MPDKATFFSITRLYTKIQADHDNVGTSVVVSLNAAKAFDSVEWPYLWATLEDFGFGQHFIQWVKLLYHAPTAVEPLAQCSRTDAHLVGLRRGAFEECIGLYADDMILFSADPGSSLSRVLYLIDRFGKFSGLQINWFKSHVLPLNSFPRTLQHTSLPLQWCSSIKYLGLEVTCHIPDFSIINVNPLLEFVHAKTRSWSRQHM